MKIKGFISDIFAVLSGVGEGTHLGPIMFIIFINYSPTKIKHSENLYFADDTKIYREIISIGDVNLLQQGVNSSALLCDENGLECNAKK